MPKQLSFTKNLKYDIPAAFVVFLVAIPLCLGIALASHAPLFSGLIAGIIGGVVIGFISRSNLSVSGPAAGLTAIVISAIEQLPTFQAFLLSVFIAGILQIILGIFKAGVIGEFIPNTVIKGMLAAVGIIIMYKQVSILLGYLAKPATFMDYFYNVGDIVPLSLIIGISGVMILIVWEKYIGASSKFMSYVPGGLIVVLLGVFINQIFYVLSPSYAIEANQLVSIPVASSVGEFLSFFQLPDFSFITQPTIWLIGLTIALVASVETLLCVEGVDKLDTEKRVTPKNHELIAQGSGNILSGLVGGLPITSVIVRSSANVNAGGKTKVSTILHGVLLLASTVLFANVLNLIPLASLAAILVFTGYKLCNIGLIKYQIKNGHYQYLPFIITIVAILFTDLLVGVIIGVLSSFILLVKRVVFNKTSLEIAEKSTNEYVVNFGKNITFLHKKRLKDMLKNIPTSATKIIFDESTSESIDKDVRDYINEFIYDRKESNSNLKIEVIPYKGI